jgi:isocitrate dehydrogenase kinase/phosphatase
MSEQANRTARAIMEAFAAYHDEFEQITHRAKGRFERREWSHLHEDAEQRLDLYKTCVDKTVQLITRDQGSGVRDQGLPATLIPDKAFWVAVKQRYTQFSADRDDFDLAESFYNSVVMRIVTIAGVDADIEFVGSEFKASPPSGEQPVYRAYPKKGSTQELMREVLMGCGFGCGFFDLDRDAGLVAKEIDSYLKSHASKQQIDEVEIANPVFYRGKVAYIVGRIRTYSRYVPLVMSLLNTEEGIHVDAVLLTQDEVSIIFSFARSYFHVELGKPRAMVSFLKSIMPLKPVAELYISLGYNKHGKTELYRDLRRHLGRSTDQFEIARGDRGMVMSVFTLPSYDVVFKIIKDTFDAPKTNTRRDVMERYQLVFKHDRGGRLVDAQEFEHLRFDKDRFSHGLLAELLSLAANTVSVEGDSVVIDHLYTERRLTPLNLYFREVDAEAAHEAVIDYGQAIKDLAATNIFPGDILLKNFGVTRHGRVVFYDYDELCLLTDCTFRKIPEARDSEEELYAEPWFSVGENDVFPEEMQTFLGLQPQLARVFIQEHGDLFQVAFWSEMQARHRAGEVLDILPYKESKRLPPT